MADRRHPLRRVGRPKPKSPSLCHPSWLVDGRNACVGAARRTLRALENLAQVSKSQGPRSPTSRPRPRSEGMAPDGAALETAHNTHLAFEPGRHSPHLPAHCLRLRTSTARADPVERSPLRWVALLVSAGDEVSASLLTGCAAAGDIGLCRRAGCLPQRRRGSSPSVAHGYGIDNFLSIGVPQAPKCIQTS